MELRKETLQALIDQCNWYALYGTQAYFYMNPEQTREVIEYAIYANKALEEQAQVIAALKTANSKLQGRIGGLTRRLNQTEGSASEDAGDQT